MQSSCRSEGLKVEKQDDGNFVKLRQDRRYLGQTDTLQAAEVGSRSAKWGSQVWLGKPKPEGSRQWWWPATLRAVPAEWPEDQRK